MECKQAIYLRRYLEDLGAKTVVVEPYYFDRDYLSEFAAFYCVSASGYPNICQRLHFFDQDLDRSMLQHALSNDDASLHQLRSAYLGFVVLRPIPGSPLGRTVLGWYPDQLAGKTPRVVAPSRDYDCHVGGIKLTVRGLAWQQQDSAVGACATIALWSMLHSSALAGHHGLPTTAEVTLSAHRTSSYGRRVFPNAGLNIQQLCEAIKGYGLSPVVVPGDVARPGSQPGFSRERFAASCAAMLRSGFPALVLGELNGTGHAVCAIGFRSAAPPAAPQGTVVHHDADIPHIYIHDDNLGPGVRFAIGVEDGLVSLRPEAPPRVAHTVTPDPTISYPAFVPGHLVIAVPEDLRTSPDALHVIGLQIATKLSTLFDATAKQAGRPLPGFAMSTQFSRLRDYLGRDLEQVVGHKPTVLGRARLELIERVPPMSAHLGVVRVGDGAVPLFDVLIDTTDSDSHLPVFAYVVYVASMLPALSAMIALDELPRAHCVDAS
ncbi:MAG TPA: hypothetical protein VH165_31505 [Kofleriaceae bacterium]|nr:hypothetical protein [Kofleriaceae bacterium]